MWDQSMEEYISTYISKLLKKKFGKGPETCRTTKSGNYLVTHIQGFLTPMEDILLQQGQYKYVDQARKVIINHILEEIKGVVQVTLKFDVKDHYHDWNFLHNSGIIIFVFEGNDTPSVKPEIDIGRLEKEIARITCLVQKVPDYITTYPISPSTYLVERSGIFIQIEKALIEKGFQKELLLTKDELEKNYFYRYGRFEDIFHKSVKDIFIDWNIKEDKSLMAFILN